MPYDISKRGVWISTGTISADTPWIVKAGDYSVVEGNTGDLHLYIVAEKNPEICIYAEHGYERDDQPGRLSADIAVLKSGQPALFNACSDDPQGEWKKTARNNDVREIVWKSGKMKFAKMGAAGQREFYPNAFAGLKHVFAASVAEGGGWTGRGWIKMGQARTVNDALDLIEREGHKIGKFAGENIIFEFDADEAAVIGGYAHDGQDVIVIAAVINEAAEAVAQME